MSQMVLFMSLGELLLAHRGGRPQKQVAEQLGVNLRTYGRWERNDALLPEDQLVEVARRTAIPFEVLLRLRSRLPTLYHVTNRRFAHCSFDADFVNRKTLQSYLFSGGDEGNVRQIAPATDLDIIMRFSRPLYPESARANKALLTAAITAAPQVNLICFDPRGLYVGHLLCFPLSEAAYQSVCSGPELEHQLDTGSFLPLKGRGPHALHVYSLYAACSTYAYHLVRRLVQSLVVNWDRLHDATLSRYVLTRDGQELCRKLGMKPVDITERPHWRGEIPILRYEIPLAALSWLSKYRESVLTNS